jgi:tetratricopeptide (TPR) repeat protein
MTRTQNKLDKLVSWLAPLLTLLLTGMAFFPALQNGFVDWDDDVNIVDNPNYRGLGLIQLRWMFTNLDMGHYQPLGWVTLGLDYVLWGMDPFGYHLTNLILHAVNAVIFYFVALRVLSWVFRESIGSREISLRFAAGFAALLFALHPLRVESVAWVTERRGLLAALFFLSSVLCYLRANAVVESNAARLRWTLAAVTAYGLSLLSKASGLGLPVVFLALDVYPLGRLSGELKEWWNEKNRKVLREKIPFLVLALVAVVLALMAERARGALRDLTQYGIADRAAQVFFGLTFYLWKTLVPSGLFPMYAAVGEAVPAYWWVHPNEAVILAASITITLAVSAVLFLLRRRWPAGLAGWVGYVAILAPVLGFVRIGEQIAADRYSYLACLGWAIMAGGGAIYFWRLWTERRIGFGQVVLSATLGITILAGLGTLSWRQTRLWHDSDALFRHILTVSPRSKMAHLNLGYDLASRGRFDEAIKHYRQALEIDPDYSIAFFDMADALSKQGKLDEAAQYYRHVIELSPRFLVTYQNLGTLLAKQGKLEEAAENYRRAIERNPNFAEAHNNLGLVLAGRGKLDEAIGHYRKALELNPAFALAHVNFGDALVLRGQVDEAIGHLRKALEVEPRLAAAHYSLGRALAQKGDLAQAIEEFKEAVKSDEKYAAAYYEMGNAYFRLGQHRDALEQYRQAAKINPNYAVAYYAMGNAYFERGQYREAVEQYRQAVKINPSYAVAYYNMANALLKTGEIDKAIDRYRTAIKYDPRHAEAYLKLGNALEARGKVEEAIGEYRRAVEIDPQNAGAHFNLATALLKRGDFKGAREHFGRSIEIHPRYAAARTNLGWVLAQAGEKKEAEEQYRKALEIDPRYGPAHFNLGLLLRDRGDVDGAIGEFSKVIEIDPKDAEGHYHLGTLLAAAGKNDRALDEFIEALRIEPRYTPARQGLERLLAAPSAKGQESKQ